MDERNILYVNSQERISRLSSESVFHTVINVMLMLKEAASLGENEMRTNRVSCTMHPNMLSVFMGVTVLLSSMAFLFLVSSNII